MAKHLNMHRLAVEQLILAFEKGARNGGSVEWDDLKIAHQYAMSAIAPRTLANLRKQLDDPDA